MEISRRRRRRSQDDGSLMIVAMVDGLDLPFPSNADRGFFPLPLKALISMVAMVMLRQARQPFCPALRALGQTRRERQSEELEVRIGVAIGRVGLCRKGFGFDYILPCSSVAAAAPTFFSPGRKEKRKKKKKAESAVGSSPSTRSDAIRCDLTQPNYAFLVSLTKPELDYRARFDSAL